MAQHHKNGRLNAGILAQAESLFPLKRRQISLIWNKAKDSVITGSTNITYLENRAGRYGAKSKYDQKQVQSSIDDLIKCTVQAFTKIERHKLDDVFLTLQKCMEACMGCGGGNNYKLPHLHKQKLRRMEKLPETILCNEAHLVNARRILMDSEVTASTLNECDSSESQNLEDIELQIFFETCQFEESNNL